MANIEKLIKAFEALKVLQQDMTNSEDAATKYDAFHTVINFCSLDFDEFTNWSELFLLWLKLCLTVC